MTTTKQKPKAAPKPKRPQPPFAATTMPGGIDRLIRICEDLRVRNTDGYQAGIGGILANVKDHGSLKVCRGTTCTPFTATVIAVAFDPTYPREDWPDWQSETVMTPKKSADPYVPMVNGGKDPMHYASFHVMHNSNGKSVTSIEHYGLGREIDAKQMRRGDFVGIHWQNGGGHGVFCWDVHLDANGDVDCFQILGSHGTYGVSIKGCEVPRWLSGSVWKEKRGTGTFKKARDPIFADEDEVVRSGVWYALPGVTKVDLDTFRVRPKCIAYKGTKGFGPYTVKEARCARLNYEGAPPAPFAMLPAGAVQTKPVGHLDGPTTKVRGENVQQNRAQVLQQVAPKPKDQEKDKPTRWQLEIEQAMQDFFRARWIETDPGSPDGINDAKTQAAVKDFQRRFDLEDDGIAGSKTRPVLRAQRLAVHRQATVQEELARLFRGKKLRQDPGPANGVNGPETKAAVEEFQRLVGLEPRGIPDAATQAKLTAFLAEQEATTAKPGLEPAMQHLYWVGNRAEPGGTARLRLHCRDLVLGQSCPIELRLEGKDEKTDALVPMVVAATTAEAVVPIPATFGPGSRVVARVTAALEGEGELEANTGAPLVVTGGTATEPVDWRPYVGKGELPAELCEAIARNRARWPQKTLPLTGRKSKPAYVGPHKYDYRPPAAHAVWAKQFFQAKVDAAPPHQQLAARAFLLMLGAEGRPASIQTYDNQIVTWGVGLGAKGDGVHAFEHLNRDPAMQRLLDDIGINYFGRDYHVVDLRTRKVVSSGPGPKGNDERHIVALESWRQQPDLLSAIIGISEDPATREAVAESQYAVYLSNSASWKGQDRVHTLALFFMIAHMYHWMPAIAKRAFDVEREFAALGASEPSLATDRRLALRTAQAFAKKAGEFFAKRPVVADDVRTRTRTRLWKKLQEDGAREGFDPGPFSYAD